MGEGVQRRRLTKHLMDHGLSQEEAEIQAGCARAFGLEVRGAKPEWPNGTMEGSVDAASSSSTAAAAPSAAGKTGSNIPLGDKGLRISVSTKPLFRRLHYIGKRFRFPGVHDQEFEFLGVELPEEGDFCRQCWKDGAPEAQHGGTASVAEVADRAESGLEGGEASEVHSSSTDAEA